MRQGTGRQKESTGIGEGEIEVAYIEVTMQQNRAGAGPVALN